VRFSTCDSRVSGGAERNAEGKARAGLGVGSLSATSLAFTSPRAGGAIAAAGGSLSASPGGSRSTGCSGSDASGALPVGSVAASGGRCGDVACIAGLAYASGDRWEGGHRWTQPREDVRRSALFALTPSVEILEHLVDQAHTP
jgi:hypothetical protein